VEFVTILIFLKIHFLKFTYTFTEKFWTVLYSDYKEVAQDTLKEIKTRPRKAAVYFSGKY